MLPSRTYIAAGIGAGTLVATFMLIGFAPAPQSPDCTLEADLPIPYNITTDEVAPYYVGTFTWDGSVKPQQTALDVHSVGEATVDGRPILEVTGRGTYTHSRVANFTFRMAIDRETGEFTMTESDPDVASGFITEGRHNGTIDLDAENITARWLDDFGGQGTLKLQATKASGR